MATQSYSNVSDANRRGGASEEAKAKAQEAGSTAKQQAGQLADQAREQAATQAEQQKNQATHQLDDVRSALDETSDNLRSRDQDAIAQYVDQAAQQVGGLSEYLQTHTVSELIGEAERYARREPALFLGGSMLAGLLGARFLKSSSRSNGSRRTSDYRPRSYGGRPEHFERGRPSSGQAYSDVHGTRDAEMPNDSDTGTATAEAHGSTLEERAATEPTTRAAERREGEDRI